MSVALNPAMIAVMETDVAPLRVAIYLADLNPHHDQSVGVAVTTRSLIRKLARREALVITQVVSRSSYAEHEHPTILTRRLPFRTDATIGRLVADAIHPWLARPKVDLWYYPRGYVSRIATTSTPSVGTLHDTITQYKADHYPQSLSPRAYRTWIGRTRRGLLRHRCVMTVSRHAAQRLAEFCERHRIVAPPIEVTYEASDWEWHRGDVFQKAEYVLHLASSSPHKRTNTLLRMWRQLQKNNVELPELKLLGTLDAEGQSLVKAVPGVTFLPPVDRDRLRDLMGAARALLLPSEIESFGLPALEAYYVRTPVCYVRGTAVTEVVQDPEHRGAFDLEDAGTLRSALDKVLALSAVQVRAFADAMYEQFSTERVADRVIRVMRASAAKAEP